MMNMLISRKPAALAAFLLLSFMPGVDAVGHGGRCWWWSSCDSGLSCHPGKQRCYYSPRRLSEPCSLGYDCGSGLSCQPVVHQCYHSPRQYEEPCSLGYDCGSGLSCQPGVHQCYHLPRRIGEPCVAGHECGDGLYCQAVAQTCAEEWVTKCPDSQPCPVAPSSSERYDAIIVGAGGSGAAAAEELVNNGMKVILIERGPWDTDIPETQTGNTWPDVVLSAATEAFRFKDGTWGAVGQVVGGGTAVNDGLFIEEDEAWFKEAFGSDFDYPLVRALYENIGSRLSAPLEQSDWSTAWIRGTNAAGFTPYDSAGSRMKKTGTFRAFSTFVNNIRHGAAELIRGKEGPNFKVMTNTLVTKIVMNGNRAVGVETKPHCGCSGSPVGRVTINADRVILAAGAIRTPQLLMLSGVGPSGELAKNNIPVKVASDQVGQNFIDRNVLALGTLLTNEIPSKFLGYSVSMDPETKLIYESVGGPGVGTGFAKAQVGLLPPSQRTKAAFDLNNLATDIGVVSDTIDNSLMAFCLNQVTRSRGNIELRDGELDARRPPIPFANYYEDGRDIASQRNCYQKLVELVDGTQLGTTSLPPRPSSSGLDSWIRRNTMTSYHYFGTAAAGTVVDPRSGAVRGASGLYVFDASAIPIPTTVNPQATIMALGAYYANKMSAQGLDAAGRRLEEAIAIRDA